jgi:hypothetical protein
MSPTTIQASHPIPIAILLRPPERADRTVYGGVEKCNGQRSYQFVNSRYAEGQANELAFLLQVAEQCLRVLLFVVVAIAMGTIAIKIHLKIQG